MPRAIMLPSGETISCPLQEEVDANVMKYGDAAPEMSDKYVRHLEDIPTLIQRLQMVCPACRALFVSDEALRAHILSEHAKTDVEMTAEKVDKAIRQAQEQTASRLLADRDVEAQIIRLTQRIGELEQENAILTSKLSEKTRVGRPGRRPKHLL